MLPIWEVLELNSMTFTWAMVLWSTWALTRTWLENWNVDYCGNFIFLSSRKNAKTLKSYLGAQYSYLKDISHKIQECIHSAQWTWKCNWKICLENSIDEYHAVFVHPTTFKKLVNPKPKYYFEGNVMGMDLPLSDSYIKDFDKLKKYFINNSNKYSHLLIFPLSTIATTMEHSFFFTKIHANRWTQYFGYEWNICTKFK